jgi:hypothetical protein
MPNTKSKKTKPMTDKTGEAEGRLVRSAGDVRATFNLRPKKDTVDKIRERHEASMLTEERLGRSRLG